MTTETETKTELQENETTGTKPNALVPVNDNIEVTASNPDEMVQSQHSLIAWCAQKIETVKTEASELEESYHSAVEKKWASNTLKKHWHLAVKRVQFFEKIKAALEAGYCIVPTFPVELFAIRTGKETPKWRLGSFSHSTVQDGYFHEVAQVLPIGEGENKSDVPETSCSNASFVGKDGKTIEKYNYHATAFKDVEFPINMANPKIMEITDRAMALKVFDEFGVLPSVKKKVDPMIVGRIIDPRPTGYNPKKVVTFIIAWHLNTSVL